MPDVDDGIYRNLIHMLLERYVDGEELIDLLLWLTQMETNQWMKKGFEQLRQEMKKGELG